MMKGDAEYFIDHNEFLRAHIGRESIKTMLHQKDAFYLLSIKEPLNVRKILPTHYNTLSTNSKTWFIVGGSPSASLT
jgi:hypothetical protein